MACGYFLVTLLEELPFWWIPTWTVHLLLHFQLWECDGIHTPQRIQITAARGICTVPYFHLLYPKCQCIAAPPDRNHHNIEFAECQSPWPLGRRAPKLRIRPHYLMLQSESAVHIPACHLLGK